MRRGWEVRGWGGGEDNVIGSCEGGLLVNNVGSFGEGGGGEKIVE